MSRPADLDDVVSAIYDLQSAVELMQREVVLAVESLEGTVMIYSGK